MKNIVNEVKAKLLLSIFLLFIIVTGCDRGSNFPVSQSVIYITPTPIIVEPTPTEVAANDRKWSVCLLVYKKTDLIYTDKSGISHRINYTMTEDDINNTIKDFFDFIYLTQMLSEGYCDIWGEARVMINSANHVSPVGDANSVWLSPKDTEEEIRPLLLRYESFLVSWVKTDLVYAYGLGYGFLTEIDNKAITYGTVTEMKDSSLRKYVFLHEWLHGVVFYYENISGRKLVNIDRPEDYGYSYDTLEHTRIFYNAVLTGKIKEGISLALWEEGSIRRNKSFNWKLKVLKEPFSINCKNRNWLQNQ